MASNDLLDIIFRILDSSMPRIGGTYTNDFLGNQDILQVGSAISGRPVPATYFPDTSYGSPVPEWGGLNEAQVSGLYADNPGASLASMISNLLATYRGGTNPATGMSWTGNTRTTPFPVIGGSYQLPTQGMNLDIAGLLQMISGLGTPSSLFPNQGQAGTSVSTGRTMGPAEDSQYEPPTDTPYDEVPPTTGTPLPSYAARDVSSLPDILAQMLSSGNLGNRLSPGVDIRLQNLFTGAVLPTGGDVGAFYGQSSGGIQNVIADAIARMTGNTDILRTRANEYAYGQVPGSSFLSTLMSPYATGGNEGTNAALRALIQNITQGTPGQLTIQNAINPAQRAASGLFGNAPIAYQVPSEQYGPIQALLQNIREGAPNQVAIQSITAGQGQRGTQQQQYAASLLNALAGGGSALTPELFNLGRTTFGTIGQNLIPSERVGVPRAYIPAPAQQLGTQAANLFSRQYNLPTPSSLLSAESLANRLVQEPMHAPQIGVPSIQTPSGFGLLQQLGQDINVPRINPAGAYQLQGQGDAIGGMRPTVTAAQQPNFYQDIISRAFGAGRGLTTPSINAPQVGNIPNINAPGFAIPQAATPQLSQLPTVKAPGFPEIPKLLMPQIGTYGPQVSDIQGQLRGVLSSTLKGGGLSPEYIQAASSLYLEPQQEALFGRLNMQGLGVAKPESGLFQEMLRRNKRDFMNQLILGGQENLLNYAQLAASLGRQEFEQSLSGAEFARGTVQQNIANALQAEMANQQAMLQRGQLTSNLDLQTQLANLQASQGTQQLGSQNALQTALANMQAALQGGQFNVQTGMQAQTANQDIARQIALINTQNTMQAALANQQAGISTQQLGVQAGLQGLGLLPGMAESDVQRQVVNQQLGLQGFQQALAAAMGGADVFGRGTTLEQQAQQANQEAMLRSLGLSGDVLGQLASLQTQLAPVSGQFGLQAGQANQQAQLEAMRQATARQQTVMDTLTRLGDITSGLPLQSAQLGLQSSQLGGQLLSQQAQIEADIARSNPELALRAALANQENVYRTGLADRDTALRQVDLARQIQEQFFGQGIQAGQLQADQAQQMIANALTGFQAVPSTMFPFIQEAGRMGLALDEEARRKYESVAGTALPYFQTAAQTGLSMTDQLRNLFQTTTGANIDTLRLAQELLTREPEFTLQATQPMLQNQQQLYGQLQSNIGNALQYLTEQNRTGLGQAGIAADLARQYMEGVTRERVAGTEAEAMASAAKSQAVGQAIAALLPSIISLINMIRGRTTSGGNPFSLQLPGGVGVNIPIPGIGTNTAIPGWYTDDPWTMWNNWMNNPTGGENPYLLIDFLRQFTGGGAGAGGRAFPGR